MRHWNYRILKRVIQPSPNSGNEPEDDFGIYECYYDRQGRIHSFSTEPRPVAASSLAELKDEISRMARAFKSPVLDYDKLPEPGALSWDEDPVEDVNDLSDTEDEAEVVIKS